MWNDFAVHPLDVSVGVASAVVDVVLLVLPAEHDGVPGGRARPHVRRCRRARSPDGILKVAGTLSKLQIFFLRSTTSLATKHLGNKVSWQQSLAVIQDSAHNLWEKIGFDALSHQITTLDKEGARKTSTEFPFRLCARF